MLNGSHSTNKKKPRVRNRPKNKANRDQCPVEIASVAAPVAEAPHSAAAPTVPLDEHQLKLDSGQNEAVKLIQKLLRHKLLCKSRAKDPPSQAPLIEATTSEVAGKVFPTNEFINQLQKEVGDAFLAKSGDSPAAALFSNLGKLLNQAPAIDIETSDEETEYVEYIYKPRQYFVVTLCNLCRRDLCRTQMFPCSRCGLTYYCTRDHMKHDQEHRQLCYGLQQVAEASGNDIFYKCGDFTTEQFRSYRIVTIRKIESLINRTLNATEQEIILFPRICNDILCREHRFERLSDCRLCGQVAFCKRNPKHLSDTHQLWCSAYQLFKSLVTLQTQYGPLQPTLPSKVLKELPANCCNTKQIFSKLGLTEIGGCEYAALTQISTGPLTAWYVLKLTGQLKQSASITVHLIGAEIEFEVDVLHKWELFLLHITPAMKQLNVVFIGPELNPRNISFDQLRRTSKCCRQCRKNGRNVEYNFMDKVYHEYCKMGVFMKPDLVCFFNAGLYRSTGYALEDTWPETIQAVANLKCPVIVSSYTKYESPLDLSRFLQESNRHLNVILPPTMNPFASSKPERNFISDEEAPLMFKNFYCFIIE